MFGKSKEKPGQRSAETQLPENIAPRRTEPEKPRGGARLKTEAAILEDRQEAKEKESRTLNFSHAVYGKVVQEEGGPILAGYEHAVTGHSGDVPEKLRSLAHPNKWPFGDSANTKSIWREEGGPIVKMTVIADGQTYVAIGRKNFLSEAGAGKPGRNYTQAHFAFIPAKDWSVAAIPKLADSLQAKPMTKENSNLDSIEMDTGILDEPLPPDWFDDETKEMLIRILAGKPMSVQNWDASVHDFLKKIYHLSLCLPEKVARQISFGSGLGEMKGELRLAYGERAQTSPRKIGASWKGEDQLDKSIGKEYLIALMSGVGSCETPRDVMRLVSELPTELLQKAERNVFPE